MTLYCVKCIFKAESKNCLHLWSSWMKLMEEKYNDERLTAVLKPIEDYI